MKRMKCLAMQRKERSTTNSELTGINISRRENNMHNVPAAAGNIIHTEKDSEESSPIFLNRSLVVAEVFPDSARVGRSHVQGRVKISMLKWKLHLTMLSME